MHPACEDGTLKLVLPLLPTVNSRRQLKGTVWTGALHPVMWQLAKREALTRVSAVTRFRLLEARVARGEAPAGSPFTSSETELAIRKSALLGVEEASMSCGTARFMLIYEKL